MFPLLDTYDWGEAFGYAGEQGTCAGTGNAKSVRWNVEHEQKETEAEKEEAVG